MAKSSPVVCGVVGNVVNVEDELIKSFVESVDDSLCGSLVVVVDTPTASANSVNVQLKEVSSPSEKSVGNNRKNAPWV